MRLILGKIAAFGIFCLVILAALGTSMAIARDQASSERAVATVDASSNGLQLQLESILNAARKNGDRKLLDDLIDNLRVPESPNWFHNTFGNEIGTRLDATYASSWKDYRDAVENMFREYAARKNAKVFVKEFSESSSVSADVFVRSILRNAAAPLVLYTAATGKNRGTDSLPGVYIFEQGNFRVVNWRTFYALPNVKPIRIKLGGEIGASQLACQAKPTPPSAGKSQKRVTGTVVLHVIIDCDGVVAKSEAVSGPPELVNLALDVVRQWRCKPVSLNGDPVETETIVSITFR